MIQPAKIQVRFSDLDVLGHVNNNIYFSYFEMARIHYLNELLGTEWNWEKFSFVLVKNEIEYLQSVLLNHEPFISVYVDTIGTKSFSLVYELKVNDELFAHGKSIQVCYDPSAKQTIDIPEAMKLVLYKIKKT